MKILGDICIINGATAKIFCEVFLKSRVSKFDMLVRGWVANIGDRLNVIWFCCYSEKNGVYLHHEGGDCQKSCCNYFLKSRVNAKFYPESLGSFSCDS